MYLKNPKLTIGIPIYNRISFFDETFESILHQNYEDFEIIVIDDNSESYIYDYLEKRTQNSKAKLFRNSSNMGLSANFNEICKKAKGDYICIICEDDPLQSKSTLTKMTDFLDRNPDVSFVSCARRVIDVKGNHLKVISNFPNSGVFCGKKILKKCLLTKKNLIGEPSSVIFRKSSATRFFDEKYAQLVDLDMWFHLLENGNFGYIDEILTSFRKHEEQATYKNLNIKKSIQDGLFLIEDWVENKKDILNWVESFFVKYQFCNILYNKFKAGFLEKEEFNKFLEKFFSLNEFYLYRPIFKILKKIYKRI